MRRQAAALAGAAALCLLTGCAGLLHARELQELQPVQTLGFDGAPGAVILSASDPGDGEESPPVRLTARVNPNSYSYTIFFPLNRSEKSRF